MADTNVFDTKDQALAYLTTQITSSKATVYTPCVFQNTTGQTLSHEEKYDNSQDGMLYDHYPADVANGKWGAFSHVASKTGKPNASTGIVVYRAVVEGTNDHCEELLAWGTTSSQNLVYCDIYPDGQVDPPGVVYPKLQPPASDAAKMGMHTRFDILKRNAVPLVYEATLAKKDA